jgi:hypothetical protein
MHPFGGRAHIDRRHAEGKTKKEAIRYLKRHLARRIWRLLYTVEHTPPEPANRPPAPVAVGAPAIMPCVR